MGCGSSIPVPVVPEEGTRSEETAPPEAEDDYVPQEPATPDPPADEEPVEGFTESSVPEENVADFDSIVPRVAKRPAGALWDM